MATPREVRDRLAKQADTYPRIVLATALFGLISATFMVSVLAAVVGTLATEFGTTTSTMVWVVVGPNLGFAVLAVSSGKLADMYVGFNACRAYVYAVAKACDRGQTTRKDAAGAILYASEKATWMAGQSIQALGGNGYINEYSVGRLWRDAKLYEIGAGTSEIRRMLIGRELFSETE